MGNVNSHEHGVVVYRLFENIWDDVIDSSAFDVEFQSQIAQIHACSRQVSRISSHQPGTHIPCPLGFCSLEPTALIVCMPNLMSP